VGDLNGDGANDIVVGSALGGGKVRVYDGVTGQPVPLTASGATTLQPFGKSFHGGVRVATVDINQDGTAEIIAAAGYGGQSRVEVYGDKNFGTIVGGATVFPNYRASALFVAGSLAPLIARPEETV
jgi:hypothetical protein